jgi:hypothetical protein
MINFRTGVCSLFLSGLLFAEIHAEGQDEQSCGCGPRPMRVTARHIEANGVGYDQGYTTLEGFFSQESNYKLRFLDVRGHVFNNGKFAANAGLGLRYLSDRIWGGNVYYDYRQTSRRDYQQISAGLESLGIRWDFRLNGYLPLTNTSKFTSDATFDSFEDHYMIVARKREFALKGANAEVGYHLDSIRFPLYLAAGPYYLQGKGKQTWGGSLRIAADLSSYIRIEGNTSYDSLFHWIGQGQVSLIFPFGGRRQIKASRGCCCADLLALAQRAIQPVDRNEIIPIDTGRKKTAAVNPSTGQPYYFYFVDNTSSSDGTFESPFSSLIAAQNASTVNDIIYVYPGDGTNTNYNQGITLKTNQKLFGSGVAHPLNTSLGAVTIPQQTESLPIITNPGASAAVVTIADNNEIAGLHLASSATGQRLIENELSASLKTNIFVRDNSLDVLHANSFGTILNSVGGTVKFMNNQVLGDIAATSTLGLFVGAVKAPSLNVTVSGNTISQVRGNGVLVSLDPSAPSTSIVASVDIHDNLISVSGTATGISIQAVGVGAETVSAEVNIARNTISGGQIGIALLPQLLPTVVIDGQIIQNVISGTTSNGMLLQASSNGQMAADVLNNTMTVTAGTGFTARTLGGSSTICLSYLNNTSNATVSFNRGGGTIFNYEPLSGNTPAPTLTGAPTQVPAGTCN